MKNTLNIILLNKEKKMCTFEVREQMLRDEPRRLRAAMAVVDPYERAVGAIRGRRLVPAQRPRLNLAPVLQEVIRLDHRHGELPHCVAAEVLVPEEAFGSCGGVMTKSRPLPARAHDLQQRR